MARHLANENSLRPRMWGARRTHGSRPEVHRPWLAHNALALVLSTMGVIAGLVMVTVVDPYSGAVASPSFSLVREAWRVPSQKLQTGDSGQTVASRDGLATVGKQAQTSAVPAAGVPDPDTAQAIGYKMVLERGWSTSEFDCLVLLWNRESHWNVYSSNTSSGAYGIPQALPGEKMASAGDDWQTNPVTQITWGLNYIEARYGTPCNAWAHSEATGWY